MNKEETFLNRRLKVFERDSNRCRICGSGRNIVLHHIAYDLCDKRLVPPKFLITLCAKCHRRLTYAYQSPQHPPSDFSNIKSETVWLEIPNIKTFTDGARILGVTRTTVYNLVERHKLHPVVIGRNRYILRSELDQLLEERNKNNRINDEAALRKAAS